MGILLQVDNCRNCCEWTARCPKLAEDSVVLLLLFYVVHILIYNETFYEKHRTETQLRAFPSLLRQLIDFDETYETTPSLSFYVKVTLAVVLSTSP